MFTDPTITETIAQAAADAAYNAVHSVLAAHTAPGVRIVESTAPAAPALTLPQAAPMVAFAHAQDGTGWEAADTYAAFRTWQGITPAAWKAYEKADKAAIRAAQVAAFDRVAHKGDVVKAAAAFGAQVAPVVAEAPQAAPVSLLAFADMTIGAAPQAPAKARKAQSTGLAALNALKHFAKTHKMHVPTCSDDVHPDTWATVVAYVEAERASGHVVTTDTICVWLSAQTGR